MITPQDAQNIARNYVRKRKSVEKAEVISTEQKEEGYIVKGTCPIDVGGHLWMESFEVVVDVKGKVKDSDFKLI